MAIMTNESILIAFNTINLLGVWMSVSLTKSDSGGTAIRIPGSEWYLEASAQDNTRGNLEIRNFFLSL